MDPEFKSIVDGLHLKFESLMSMEPVTVDTAPKDTPKGGIYLFSKGADHLYVGRTKRIIRNRLRDHVSTANDCPFAWHLAREATDNKVASYKTKGSRKHLMTQPHFKKAYESAKEGIREMEVRYIGESDPLRQALLEIYVAVATKAKHNDSSTH